MKLTKKEAKRLSILKWEFIVGNGGDYDSYIVLPVEVQPLIGECGYCEKYNPFQCIGCPLNLPDIGYCRSDEHPFNVWSNNSTPKTAQAVLDLIKKS